MAELSSVLQLPQPRFARLVQQHPAISNYTPDTLELTIRTISDVAGIRVAQVAELIEQAPQLLLQPQTVRANLLALQQLLQLPPPDAFALVRRLPAILGLQPESLARQIRQLCTGTQYTTDELLQRVMSAPKVLLPSPEDWCAKVEALAFVLGVSDLAAHRLLLAQPACLSDTQASQALQLRLQQLAAVLQLDAEAAAQLAAQSGHLLMVNDALLSATRRRLFEMFPDAMSDVRAMQLLAQHPGLITTPNATIQVKWGLLQQLVGSSTDWSRGVGEPDWCEAAAQLLLASYAQLARLKYLAATEQQGTMGMVEAVEAAEGAFNARFPDFQKWLKSG